MVGARFRARENIAIFSTEPKAALPPPPKIVELYLHSPYIFMVWVIID
jgi:hypothetical protein